MNKKIKKPVKKTNLDVKSSSAIKIIAQNRRAGFDYALKDHFEAGIVLLGSEVKMLRLGRCSIAESYVSYNKDGYLELINVSIPSNNQLAIFSHEERRPRKLLLHKKEILKIKQELSKKGLTAVPVKLYFKRGLAKLDFAIAGGKTNVDKRQVLKEKAWKKEQSQVIKNFNVKY
jgi:SsrA-binding protein